MGTSTQEFKIPSLSHSGRRYYAKEYLSLVSKSRVVIDINSIGITTMLDDTIKLERLDNELFVNDAVEGKDLLDSIEYISSIRTASTLDDTIKLERQDHELVVDDVVLTPNI